MRKMQRFMAAVLATLFLAVMTACGGGGGGGGYTPITYTGATGPASITNGTDAGDMAAQALFGSDMTSVIPIASATSGSSQAGVPAPVIPNLLELVENIPGMFGNMVSADGSVAAVPFSMPPEPCTFGGSMSMTGDWNMTTGDMTATMNFSACNEGDVIMRGALAFTVTGVSEDPFGEPDITSATMSITFQNLSMEFPLEGETITVAGALTMDVAAATSTMNLVMREESTGMMVKIENYVVAGTSLITISGTVYNSDKGYFTIITDVPLVVDPAGGYPTSGVYRIVCDDFSYAEVDFSATPNGSWYDSAGVFQGNFSL